MANAITLAQKYLKAIDAVYAAASLTDILRGQTQDSEFLGANEIKVLKVTTQGLATHNRGAAMADGDITAEWETMTLTQQRSRRFVLDRCDDEETLDMTMATVVGEFVRTKVVPEVDAYRFATLAGKAGITATATTYTDVAALISDINNLNAQMTANGVPAEGRILYFKAGLMSLLSQKVKTTVLPDGQQVKLYEGIDVPNLVIVPDNRFYTGITITATGDGGYVNAGEAINFMIVSPDAVKAPVKIAQPKLFDPDSDDSGDNWRFLFRLYHDLFVLDNKVKGIGVSAQAAA